MAVISQDQMSKYLWEGLKKDVKISKTVVIHYDLPSSIIFLTSINVLIKECMLRQMYYVYFGIKVFNWTNQSSDQTGVQAFAS